MGCVETGRGSCGRMVWDVYRTLMEVWGTVMGLSCTCVEGREVKRCVEAASEVARRNGGLSSAAELRGDIYRCVEARLGLSGRVGASWNFQGRNVSVRGAGQVM